MFLIVATKIVITKKRVINLVSYSTGDGDVNCG